MKKWTNPEVAELKISETANGIKWWYDEGTKEPWTGSETILGEVPTENTTPVDPDGDDFVNKAS